MIGMKGVPYSVYIEDVGPEKVDVVKVLFEITGDLTKAEEYVEAALVVILEDGTDLSVAISGIESFRVVYEEASEGDNVGVYLDGGDRKDVETATKLIIKAE